MGIQRTGKYENESDSFHMIKVFLRGTWKRRCLIHQDTLMVDLLQISVTGNQNEYP